MRPLCECGCGCPTNQITVTSARRGYVKGAYHRFLNGHNTRLRFKGWEERDCGYTSLCWIWLGHTTTTGYGAWKGTTAHRAVYEQHRGLVSPDLHLDHLCRNPPCVNPDHLEPVTSRENVRRGYAVRKAANASDGFARALREHRIAWGLSQSDLAAKLGCSQARVALWETGGGRFPTRRSSYRVTVLAFLLSDRPRILDRIEPPASTTYGRRAS
jgi:DNA-binding XRE family transcriptional regulator